MLIPQKYFFTLVPKRHITSVTLSNQQVDRLEDRFGRCKEVDVFIHASKEAVDKLIEIGHVVNHAMAADLNPRVALPASMGRDGKSPFASLKECSQELLEKLYLQQG